MVASDFVYVATTDGKVIRGDAGDFTTLSTYQPGSLSGVAINLPLVLQNGTIYITPSNNTLHAVSTTNMTTAKWSTTYGLGTGNTGPAFIANLSDSLYTAVGNYVYLYKSDGTKIWNTADLTAQVGSGPIAYNQSVYFGRNSGYYYALNDADGSVRSGWPYTSASGNATSGPWIDVTNSRVIFGTTGGNLDAFTLEP